jgi:hypothetical protein
MRTDSSLRYVDDMQVVAFSTPAHPEWRWRIMDYAGEIIEESRDGFATITAAVVAGTAHLVRLRLIDRSNSMPPR